MTYKGSYSADSTYSEGDVVIYTDGVAYHCIRDAAAGVTPHEERCWEYLRSPLQEIVCMISSYLDGIKAAIPDNISDDAITLKDESDNEYLVTVDASGDTPELAVTLIEPEEEEEET